MLLKLFFNEILVNNLSKEKVEGITVQAYNTETKQLTETSIDKNMEYRLRGLNPDQQYVIKVKIPFKSSNLYKFFINIF